MDVSSSITVAEFQSYLAQLFVSDFSDQKVIAVGLSGGPDSLALTKLLSEWGEAHGVQVHALIVDHGLRDESAEEALQVQDLVSGLGNVQGFVLRWDGEKPETKLMEEARRARYALMAQHCQAQGISYLFLGHHADDQAETVLFRLSKGSGLDGLCGMRAVQDYGDGIQLVRPFLSVEKERLVATCEHYGLNYVRDPSNEKAEYARPRMREAREVLEREGLTAKRLGVTAMRLQRARLALDEIAENILHNTVLEERQGTKQEVRLVGAGADSGADSAADSAADSGAGVSGVVLAWPVVREQPAEIGLRVLIKAIKVLRPEADYLPRMEKIEALFVDLCSEEDFRKRTLGGLMFERDDEARTLTIHKEV